MKLGGVKGSSYEMMSSTEAWDMLPSCGKVSAFSFLRWKS